MHIICLGLSHQTARVELREKFAVRDADLREAAECLGRMDGIRESVILSTCNRVELYAATDNIDSGFRSLRRFMGGSPSDEQVFYQHETPQCARHLFRVVSGMESMVLGETEILGQVKKAYGAALAGSRTSRHLNKLFQRAFNVAKEVRTNTGITRGSVSVGSATVDLAEKIFGRLQGCKVMIIGAGETGEMTLRTLFSRGLRHILVSNRSHDRAVALAAETGGSAVPFDGWRAAMPDIDILIASTAAPHPILNREAVAPIMAQRRNRPLFVIDLAVPRNVEPSVHELEGVYVYDIDSLQAIAHQSMEVRRKEISACEQLIERHVGEFLDWSARTAVCPVAGLRQMLSARQLGVSES